MLTDAGVTYEAVDAPLDEEAAKAKLAGLGGRDLAERLAELKASSAVSGPDDLVLGADQTLELDNGVLLGKAASRAEMRDQLRAMSGRTHHLHSAAAVILRGERVWNATESVAMTIRPLGDAFLDAYLTHEFEAVRWNVGGYRIEGMGAQLFTRVEGSHFAILGLPLLPLLDLLRERGLLLR